MTQMESPKRKMQKKNDYQRHKLFRKIKRRRKAQAEAEQQIAVKQLRKKLKLPKFGDGKNIKSDAGAPLEVKDGMLYYKETGQPFYNAGLLLPEVEVVGDKSKVNPWAAAGRHNASSYFDGNWSKDLINMAPGIGDAMDVAQVIDDASRKKYLSAGGGALMLALPNFIEKPLKYFGKKSLPLLFKYYNKYSPKDRFSLNFEQDIFEDRVNRALRNTFGADYDISPSKANWNIRMRDDLELSKFLKRNGYDISKFNLHNMQSLEQLRQQAIMSQANKDGLNRFGVFRNSAGNDWIDLYKGGVKEPIGDLSLDNNMIDSQTELANQLGINSSEIFGKKFSNAFSPVHMIHNNTIKQQFKEKGVSKDLYDIALQALHQRGDKKGIFTGFNLLQPEKTTRVTSNKNYIGSDLPGFGLHHILNEDGSRTIKKGDARLILYPKNPTVKFKSTAFDPIMGLDKNGGFIVDFNNPSMYYNSGKDIHIKSSKRGTFTKAAKQHGMSVQGFANKVLKNPSKYSAAMRKKANFAHNAASWKH